MSERMKEFIVGVIATVIFAVTVGGCLYHCTSPEYWYAGMHTEGCDGTDNCGCYEKLIQMDKERNSK